MAEPTSMEQGRLGAYPAEKPSSYNEGQTGRGAGIRGKVTARMGSKFEQGVDSHAQKLRGIWGKALNAAKRFPPF